MVAGSSVPSNGEILTHRENLRNIVVSIWEEVLGTSIHEDDSFFSVGGNSLLAVKVIALLRERLDISIGMKDILLQDTVRRLSVFLESLSNAGK